MSEQTAKKEQEKEFNLLYEPWIPVILQGGKSEELGVVDLFARAHEILDIGSELPTLDAAILRFLLAVMHSVFARCNKDGILDEVDTKHKAIERWAELWNEGTIPIAPVKTYLEYYQERFYLFHPETPFYQAASLKTRDTTKYGAKKLNGSISESENKPRIFPHRSGAKKDTLSYSEAARWLLHVNGYDDTSAKPKQKGLPSCGSGWLGKIGMIYALGNNLFETLLLNLVLLKDGEELWGKENPIWESDIRDGERLKISLPDNPSELLTLSSRRLLLERKDGQVVSYSLLGGDFFESKDAFSEQMTIWRMDKKSKGDKPSYMPKRHIPSRQLWRDYQNIAVAGQENHRPGIVEWLSVLQLKGALNSRHIQLRTVGIEYMSKDFAADDILGDSIKISSQILSQENEDLRLRIRDEIEACEKMAYELGKLASAIVKSAGGADVKGQIEKVKTNCYFALDLPFRSWLESIDPIKDEIDIKCLEWRKTAQTIVLKMGRELLDEAGTSAYIGSRGEGAIKAYIVFENNLSLGFNQKGEAGGR